MRIVRVNKTDVYVQSTIEWRPVRRDGPGIYILLF